MAKQNLFTYLPSDFEEPKPLDVQSFPPPLRIFFEENRAGSAKYVADLPRRKGWLSTHAFHPSANLCMDGRVSDFCQAVDLPIGILEMFRSAGSRTSMENIMYVMRTDEYVQASSAVHLADTVRDLAEMRMVTAHWSVSHQDTASCLSWNHRTDEAMTAALKHVHELNFCWRGRMVAIPLLIDTDLDAITFYGPGSPFSVGELFREYGSDGPPSFGMIVDALRRTYPMSWEPLVALRPMHRNEFHFELAERVMANLAFVRHVVASNRPVELLDHSERMIFIGRHADWIEEHGNVFLQDDDTQERAEVVENFRKALPHVARNVIDDAIKVEDREWIVPVVVNVPYKESDRDRLAKAQYVRHLVYALKAAIAKDKSNLFGMFGSNGIRADRLPTWMIQQVTGLADRIRIVSCVSHKKTRLFEPFV